MNILHQKYPIAVLAVACSTAIAMCADRRILNCFEDQSSANRISKEGLEIKRR